MAIEQALDVARRALALADEDRWRELAALIEEDVLESWRDRMLAAEEARAHRAANLGSGAWSTHTDEPPEVREYRRRQYEQHIRNDRIDFRFAGVNTLDELRALSAQELFARHMQASEERAMIRESGMRAVATLEEVADMMRPRRRAIGVVAESAVTAHVVYRTSNAPPPDAGRLEILTLVKALDEWRLQRGPLLGSDGPSGWYGFGPSVSIGPIDRQASPPQQIEPMPWLERTFPSGLPVGLFPALAARFEGNLQRISSATLGLSRRGRTTRPADGSWSVQEHAGHLLELERLGEARLAEYERGEPVLSGADMSNRATEQGGYNERPAYEIIEALTELRFGMLARLQRLTPEQLAHAALHPRLKQPMNVVDWLFFMCEHDDHHLARMRRLVNAHWERVLGAQP